MRRTAIVIVVAVVLLVAGGIAARRYATQLLKTQIETALGPESEVGAIEVGTSAVVIRNIRIRAPAGWPTPDALKAEVVTVKPDLGTLLSSAVRVSTITAENVYLAIYRTREGKAQLLPSLLGKPKTVVEGEPEAAEPAAPTEPEKPQRKIDIDAIELRGGVVEYFNAEIRRTPHRIRIEAVTADVGPLSFPALDTTTHIDVSGTIKGPQRDGSADIEGDARFSDMDSAIALTLEGVDLVALEPYLLQSTETGVEKGRLDLEVKSKVAKRQLTAPGTMTLSDLELSGSTFMGMSRKAVVAGLEDRQGTITIRFTLAGSLDDPKFSLRESFAMRAGTAVAESLGLSVKGLARGLGGATQKMTDKLGDLLGR